MTSCAHATRKGNPGGDFSLFVPLTALESSASLGRPSGCVPRDAPQPGTVVPFPGDHERRSQPAPLVSRNSVQFNDRVMYVCLRVLEQFNHIPRGNLSPGMSIVPRRAAQRGRRRGRQGGPLHRGGTRGPRGTDTDRPGGASEEAIKSPFFPPEKFGKRESGNATHSANTIPPTRTLHHTLPTRSRAAPPH